MKALRVAYDEPKTVREMIRYLTEHDAEELRDLALNLLHDVEVLRKEAIRRRVAKDPHGAPAGSAERARIAAEKLPTVGQWPGGAS